MLLAAAALLTASIGDLHLENGKTIPDCRLSYRQFGTLNADRSNVVLIPTWFNGTSEDFSRFVASTGLVDPAGYFVIVVDALADGVSSSPSNQPGMKGAQYPFITIRDMVESQYLLLTKVLGIHRVHAVLGVSMGAMQTFQWMVSHPDFMNKGVTIVGTPRMSEKDVELWSHFFKFGQSAAIAPGSIEKWIGIVAEAAAMYPKYKQPFNAIRQFGAITGHNIFKGRTPEDTARLITARTMAVIATQDQALSPSTPQDFARRLGSEVIELNGPCGHKAYDCELDKISGPIQDFLKRP